MTKSTYGGARPGAGRPKTKLSERKTIAFTPENKQRLNAEKNASKLINSLLDDYYDAEGKTKNDASTLRSD